MRGAIVIGAVLAIGCGASPGSGTGAGTGTGTGTAAHDPCDGFELDLGEAASHCRIEGEPEDPPAPESVAIAIATRSIASGSDSAIQIAFRNQGAQVVELDFPGTLRFDASLWQGQQRVDERWEIQGLAGGAVRCREGADCRTVRVRLAPGGTLLASVPFTARVEILRQGASAGQTVRSDGGPIAPGSYGVRVVLPWSDPVAGSATGARRVRVLEGSIAITR